MERKTALRGGMLTLTGGILWGFSGTCGQFLMQTRHLPSNWLVPYRLLLAGAILLFLCSLKKNADIFAIWKKDAPAILTFGILGMSMCQYTYFTAISASNAGTATVLQYLGPVLILIYLSLQNRQLPQKHEAAAICLAVAGSFLLATHGRPGTMILSKEALFWGLLSAAALAVYTVQPVRLLRRYGSAIVTAWGMLTGGLLLCLLFRPWSIPAVIDGEVVAGMTAVILLGTVLAFSCYMEGVKCAGPKKASLYASIEPVSAAVFSAVWMNAEFGLMDLLGFVCIISTVFLLAAEKEN